MSKLGQHDVGPDKHGCPAPQESSFRWLRDVAERGGFVRMWSRARVMMSVRRWTSVAVRASTATAADLDVTGQLMEAWGMFSAGRRPVAVPDAGLSA
jgi:hypothetical protein